MVVTFWRLEISRISALIWLMTFILLLHRFIVLCDLSVAYNQDSSVLCALFLLLHIYGLLPAELSRLEARNTAVDSLLV